ncbi:MAG TPA: T9SS type A sorting domain-containing protein [Bacteroidetes bacterium]|nr:T9SS type A sorting domain-containing protein [Bacteroidota bacterium]
MTKTYLLFLLPVFLFLNNISAQQKMPFNKPLNKKKADKIWQEIKSEYGFGEVGIPGYTITHQHISKQSGVHHIYMRQQLNGLEIIGAEAGLHISPNNKLLTSDIRFIKNINNKADVLKTPSLTAVQAVRAAAGQMGYKIKSPLVLLKNKNGGDKKTLVSDGGISLENIPAKLVYQKINGNNVVLAWDISIQELDGENWWSMRVDARTGEIIDKYNQVLKCSFENTCGHAGHEIAGHRIENETPVFLNKNIEAEALSGGTYRVYPLPLQSPHYGDRELVVNPADPVASPFGWHDTDGAAGAEYTTARGNNVHAFENGDHIGFSPDGGASLNFDFPINEVYSEAEQSEAAVTTNLFYWGNVVHDIFYGYGFDEAGGNFQANNYGHGGEERDYLKALSQRGLRCNAFMSTPGDGFSPIMRMFVGNCGAVEHDGSIDNAVIVHEYGHGISIRLTGGAANSACLLNEEQMGEGWSDWFAMMLTMQPGDSATDQRTIANWLFGKPIDGSGIRPYPYTTDLALNPHTYDDIKTAGRPHGIGTVWAAMLWEVTWALTDRYGFDPDLYHGTGGNNMALALVTEGLKLQPCSPGFVDGRDAILAADEALYGGANQCLIWGAFAKRGLGFSADQGSPFDKTDGTEAFDLPPVSTCTGITVLLGNDGQYQLSQADLNMLAGRAPEYSGSTVFTAVPAAFSCADLGENTVALTAEDICGNTNICEAKVTVVPLPASLEIEVQPETCANAGDGQISILTTAACGQTTYSIDGGANANLTGFFDNLPPGEYPVFVKTTGLPGAFELAETVIVEAGAAPGIWYKDADGDGYTDGLVLESCDPVPGYVLEALPGDCDDYNADHFPAQVWYKDADGDGYSDGQTLTACTRTEGYKLAAELLSVETDCDENDPAINPGATETCNGKDDNCNGMADEGLSGESYQGSVAFTSQAQLDAWPACYTSVNGSVTISGAGITDLSALSNLASITGSLTIYYNFSLASLNGLGGLASIGGSLLVYYNFQLADCCAIHGLLNGGVATKLVFYNKTGCNSEAEINAACGAANLLAAPGGSSSTSSFSNIDAQKTMQIFPNPTSGIVTLKLNGSFKTGQLQVFDWTGRAVISQNFKENISQKQLSLEGWGRGMYLVKVQLDGALFTEKIIVENKN